MFGRAGEFVTKNKQALINILGMSMVFSYSVHNYRVKIAWDEREVEYRRLEQELSRIKAGLSDEKWLEQTSEGVKRALKQPRLPAGTISQALRAELDLLVTPLQRTKEEIVAEKMAVASRRTGAAGAGGGGGDAELGGLIGSIVSGGDGKPSSGARIV